MAALVVRLEARQQLLEHDGRDQRWHDDHRARWFTPCRRVAWGTLYRLLQHHQVL